MTSNKAKKTEGINIGLPFTQPTIHIYIAFSFFFFFFSIFEAKNAQEQTKDMAASPDICKQRHIRFHHLSTVTMSPNYSRAKS